MTIGVEASWLLKNYNGWKQSGLKEAHAKIDLIAGLREYYAVLMADVGQFLTTAFFPQLVEMHLFFSKLRNEVAQPRQITKWPLLISNKLAKERSPHPSRKIPTIHSPNWA